MKYIYEIYIYTENMYIYIYTENMCVYIYREREYMYIYILQMENIQYTENILRIHGD